MHVVVTGGAGFIGSNLVPVLLDKGFDVTILDDFSSGRYENISDFKSQVRLVECNLAKSGDWEQFILDCDHVVHLAALADIVPSIQHPQKYFNANVTSTLNLLEILRKTSVKKLVYAASSSCYGIPKEFPTSEGAEISPQYPYALTKFMGEQLVQHWSQLYNIPCTSLRFFNVYGPKARTTSNYGAVLGVFLAQKIAKKPLTIVGNGEQTRDFTYVLDVCSAILAALMATSTSYSFYNVGSGKTISVNKIASLIGGPVVSIPKRPGEPDCTFADISKIRTELSWEPSVPIEVGMELLIENINYWADAPVWDPNSISMATKDWFKYLE